MVRCSRRRSQVALGLLIVMSLIGTGLAAWGQTPDALGYSVATSPNKSSRRHDKPQRRSDANSKPLPRQRAFREYGHADRTHSEKCDQAGASLQPRVDRV
jgi:hypothetical protein